MATAGVSIPIQNNTSPLAVMGGAARPIEVIAGGPVEGGPAIQVYELSASELAERGKSGGEPLRVSLAPGRSTQAGPAIPVYVTAGSLGGGVTPAPGFTPVYFNHFMRGESGSVDFDVIPDWTRVTGTTGNIATLYGGKMYPQNLGADALIIWSNPPVALTSNDQWCETVIGNNAWTGDHSDWIGPVVRGSGVQNDCYALVMWQDGWDLLRYDAGSKTVLASDASTPTVGNVGKRYRIEAEGTTIRALIDDVEVASVTDATHSAGTPGISGDGLDSQYQIDGISCGDLPYANKNAFKFNNGFGNYSDERYALNACNVGILDGFADSGLLVGEIHNTNETHWIEFDMQYPCTTYGIGSYNRLTYSLTGWWTEFDVYGKLEAGDSYTLVEAGLALSDPGSGSDFWREALWSGGEAGPYRYWRIDIKSTGHVDNNLTIWEARFMGRAVP
jgi:hypothetical protein